MPTTPWSQFRSSIKKTTTELFAKALGWSFLTPDHLDVSCGTLRKVPFDLASVKRCVPLLWSSRRVVLLVDDPMNGLYLCAHPEMLGSPYRREVKIVLTEPRWIDHLLDKRRRVVKG